MGALYQAHLATNLRRHGIAAALDEATGAARVTAIPDAAGAAFSKRTMNGTEAALRGAWRRPNIGYRRVGRANLYPTEVASSLPSLQ